MRCSQTQRIPSAALYPKDLQPKSLQYKKAASIRDSRLGIFGWGESSNNEGFTKT
jgi:hypothetical protein